jgi:RHS repeat-associated protein
MLVRSIRQEYHRHVNMSWVQESNTNAQTNGPCPNWSFSASTNQLTTSGFTYDAAGNLTEDSSNPTAHTYQWDAEGRVSSVDSGSTASFTYNALGHRVQRNTDGYFYDPEGNWLGTTGGIHLVPFGGHYLTVYFNGESYFHHVNPLNSVTMVTNHTGGETEDIVFYPWGQNSWQLSGTGGYIYAGMPQYDPNVEVSYAKYRFYSPNLGRSHSPDPVGGDITNPQSLNRYTYVTNGPTSFTDPLGLDPGQGSDPYQGDCDCNDPNCVNAECGGPGWPPGFWPPNGGAGSGGGGGGGPTVSLPTGNPEPAIGNSLLGSLPCLSDAAIAALAQTLVNALNRTLGTQYKYNNATVSNGVEGVTLNIDILNQPGESSLNVPVPQNLPPGSETGNTSCNFHPGICHVYSKSIRTPLDPSDVVPVTGAPAGANPPWPDNSIHIMYGTNAAGQMTRIRFHGDRWPWLAHAITFLREQVTTGCTTPAKFD